MRGALVYEAFCEAEHQGWVIFCPHKFHRNIVIGHIMLLRHCPGDMFCPFNFVRLISMFSFLMPSFGTQGVP